MASDIPFWAHWPHGSMQVYWDMDILVVTKSKLFEDLLKQ